MEQDGLFGEGFGLHYLDFKCKYLSLFTVEKMGQGNVPGTHSKHPEEVYRCSGSAFPTPGPRKLCCLNLRAYPQGTRPCPQPRAPADLSLQLSKVNTEFGCPEISAPGLQNRSRDVLRPSRRRQRFSSMQHHHLHLLAARLTTSPAAVSFPPARAQALLLSFSVPCLQSYFSIIKCKVSLLLSLTA